MIIDVTSLPEDQRISLSQQASTTDEGGFSLSISGSGWDVPNLGWADGSQEVEVKPVIPLPDGKTLVKGFFVFSCSADFDTGTVNWSLSTNEARDPNATGDSQYSEVTVALMQEGWSILRTSTGDAIPMIAYYKRSVSASGRGTPPVSASPATAINLAGVPIYVTSYNHNTKAKTWDISGVEV